MPDDSPIPGRDAEEMVLNGSVLSTVKFGGPACTVLSLMLLIDVKPLSLGWFDEGWRRPREQPVLCLPG